MDLITYTHQIAQSLHRVGLAGAAVDLKQFHKLGKQWTREAQVSRDTLTKIAHRNKLKEFSPTNDDHLRDLLYDRLGYPIIVKTGKSKEASVAKPTLKRLLKEYKKNEKGAEFIDELLKFNSVDKLASTWYGKPLAEKQNRKPSVGELLQTVVSRKDIALLHFWIFPLRARTGRRASGGTEEGDPQSRNSQNWPPAARSVIRSRWKSKIAICDFSRLEVVLVGWVSGDDKLLDYFLNGQGYIGVAKEFWGQDVEKDTLLYKATKSMVLGLDYNMGVFKLAEDLWFKAEFRFSNDWKEHVRQTKVARRKYLRIFHRLNQYIHRQIDFVTKHQYVVSPTGRIRHFPHHGPDSEGFWHIKNASVNFPIQSFASDVTGGVIVDYEKALLAEHGLKYADWHAALLSTPWDPPCSPVFNEVHDELDLDLHPRTGKKDLEILKDCMRNNRGLRKLLPRFDIKLNVDTDVTEHWK